MAKAENTTHQTSSGSTHLLMNEARYFYVTSSLPNFPNHYPKRDSFDFGSLPNNSISHETSELSELVYYPEQNQPHQNLSKQVQTSQQQLYQHYEKVATNNEFNEVSTQTNTVNIADTSKIVYHIHLGNHENAKTLTFNFIVNVEGGVSGNVTGKKNNHDATSDNMMQSQANSTTVLMDLTPEKEAQKIEKEEHVASKHSTEACSKEATSSSIVSTSDQTTWPKSTTASSTNRQSSNDNTSIGFLMSPLDIKPMKKRFWSNLLRPVIRHPKTPPVDMSMVAVPTNDSISMPGSSGTGHSRATIPRFTFRGSGASEEE